MDGGKQCAKEATDLSLHPVAFCLWGWTLTFTLPPPMMQSWSKKTVVPTLNPTNLNINRKDSVLISVSVPNIEEGNLNGQMLEVTIHSLSETISSLKDKIAVEISQPANKQKLSSQSGFLKDNLSLAYYNM